MKKFFKQFTLAEWLIWGLSVVAIVVSFFVMRNTQYVYLVGSLVGVTALIFVAKGHPLGQALTVVFAVFYGIISYTFSYFGEMITYLAMTTPMAIAALVAWLKHPYKGNKSQVEVKQMGKTEWALFAVGGIAVTVAFYFVLRALGTANLVVSTISVYTSFVASYLTFRRNKFYALGYAANDVVLVVMWALATAEEVTYLPMIICFVAFLVSDIYGFVNWHRMEKQQKQNA